jgi:hypothetical protein
VIRRVVMATLVAAACMAITTQADEDGFGYETPLTPYTESTLLLYRDKKGEWTSEVTHVPAEPGAYPRVCFRMPHKTLLECFYVSNDGDVELIQVNPEKTIT